MALFFVDVEAFGGAPSVGRMTEFGVVEYKTGKSFHGVLWKAVPNEDSPATSRLDPNAIQKTEEERKQVFLDFEQWLNRFNDKRLIFVSDNNGYDYMWMADSLWKYLGYCPFGHSSRRISDYYAGLMGDFFTPTKWKRLRITKHTHDPVMDSQGNLEAFRRLQNGER